MVAGAAVFDAEDKENCVTAILKIHTQLKLWLEELREKGEDRGGYVNQITRAIYGQKEVERFNASWIKIVGSKGGPPLLHAVDPE